MANTAYSERVSCTNPKMKGPLSPPPDASFHTASDLPCPEDQDHSEIPHATYAPSDIPLIQQTLLNFVPVELADMIMDMAEIWPWVGISRNSYTSAFTALEGGDGNAEWCYLVSPAVPALERDGVRLPTTVKKVKFFIKSYESCWGGKKSEKGSSGFKTWFEASVLKSSDQEAASYENDAHPHDWFTKLAGSRPKLLNNFMEEEESGETIAAPAPNPFDKKRKWRVMDNNSSSSDEWQEIVWDENETGAGSGFIDALSVDDRIVLTARAMSPGWINTIFNVKMEIVYSLPKSDL